MLRQFVIYMTSAALVIGTMPVPVAAQPAAPSAIAQQSDVEKFSSAQLDALLAPIALYPDTLLTQVLMAATNPVEIVAASRWLKQGSNRGLKGAALENALKSQPWDPSVKSLIPFPQVLEMLNEMLDFTQQLGFAMQVQEPEVFDAIQRLRAQAAAAGNLQSTPQQIVRTEPMPPPPPDVVVPPGAPQQVIVIEPAQTDVVFVPFYNPSQIYGAWAYSDYPPVYFPAPAGYGYGGALAAGLLFGTGIAITAGLWGWARPNWGCCWGGYRGGYGNVVVNVNRWNSFNVKRPWNGGPNGAWRPNNPNVRPGGGLNRPNGPVGRPNLPGGRPLGDRPGIAQPGGPPGLGQGNRPGGRPDLGNRPNVRPDLGNRPGGRPDLGNRPGGRPDLGNRPSVRPDLGNRPGGRPDLGNRPGGRPNLGNRPGGRPDLGNRPAARPNLSQGNRPGSGRLKPKPPGT